MERWNEYPILLRERCRKNEGPHQGIGDSHSFFERAQYHAGDNPKEAGKINRVTLEQNQTGGSKLPKSDSEDMEVFLANIKRLLPVLGSDILVPIVPLATKAPPGGILFCRLKGAEARGQRTVDGFVVFQGSTAVLEERKSAETYPYAVAKRKQLIADGTLIDKDGFLFFTKDAEFSSPSAAAAVIHGGNANGLTAWKTEGGKSLKQLDEQA
ncbi:MAG: DUF4357 domain-containing protein [Syntrophales bacterium]